jgi:hypothetical protein
MYPSVFSPQLSALETIRHEDFIYEIKKFFFLSFVKKYKTTMQEIELTSCEIYIDISMMLIHACKLFRLLLCKNINIRRK